MNLFNKYGDQVYSDDLLETIRENESEKDFEKFKNIMQKCLHLAIENEDIISGSELKVDMEE